MYEKVVTMLIDVKLVGGPWDGAEKAINTVTQYKEAVFFDSLRNADLVYCAQPDGKYHYFARKNHGGGSIGSGTPPPPEPVPA